VPSSLADPYLKTHRAKEHLDALKEGLRMYRESQPCSFGRADDLKNQLHIVNFKIKDIPDRLPLIVGDFAYCLRSSLDQVVWALAKEKGNYPRNTQFPIFSERTPETESRLTAYTRGVPTLAIREIELLQPYNGQDAAAIKSTVLYQLNRLNIIDKHHRIPTDAVAVDLRFPDFPKRFLPLARFDHEREMAIVPLDLKRYMRLDPIVEVHVFFGDSHRGLRCDFDRLEEIYEFVTNSVIPRFARFFK
jgi:hypothetical protein